MLELLFLEVKNVIDNFHIHLIPYITNMKRVKKIKELIKELHKYNIKNIMEVLISYISGNEAFKENSDDNNDVVQLNIEIKMSSQNVIEKIYNKINSDAKHFRPTISLFEKLVEHSHDPEGVETCLSIDHFALISEACTNKSLNSEPSSFNLLLKELEEIGKINKDELDELVSFVRSLLCTVSHLCVRFYI